MSMLAKQPQSGRAGPRTEEIAGEVRAIFAHRMEYPPTLATLEDRVRTRRSWSDNWGVRETELLHKFAKLNFGIWKDLHGMIMDTTGLSMPDVILTILYDYRGSDNIVIEHRSNTNAATHLEKVLLEEGFGVESIDLDHRGVSRQRAIDRRIQEIKGGSAEAPRGDARQAATGAYWWLNTREDSRQWRDVRRQFLMGNRAPAAEKAASGDDRLVRFRVSFHGRPLYVCLPWQPVDVVEAWRCVNFLTDPAEGLAAWRTAHAAGAEFVEKFVASARPAMSVGNMCILEPTRLHGYAQNVRRGNLLGDQVEAEARKEAEMLGFTVLPKSPRSKLGAQLRMTSQETRKDGSVVAVTSHTRFDAKAEVAPQIRRAKADHGWDVFAKLAELDANEARKRAAAEKCRSQRAGFRAALRAKRAAARGSKAAKPAEDDAQNSRLLSVAVKMCGANAV